MWCSGKPKAWHWPSANRTARRQAPAASARPIDEAVEHALLARLVEVDGELVAVDAHDAAIAEFLMKHAIARGEACRGFRIARHELALDDARRGAHAASFFISLLGALPARRGIAAGEWGYLIEARTTE